MRFLLTINDELYKALKEEQAKRKLNSVQEAARYILSEYFTNEIRK